MSGVPPGGPKAERAVAETARSSLPIERAPALEMRGITKRYPGVVANDGLHEETVKQ